MEVDVSAPQVPGLTRTDLQRHDLSVPGREVIQNRVDISPDAPPVRHKHPGEEIIYVLEGALEYAIDGREPATFNAGEVLLVPPETVHSVTERRQRQRGRACHLHRREGQTAPRARRLRHAPAWSGTSRHQTETNL